MFERLQGRKPVLFLSGGLDSLLLLVLLIEQKQVFEIIQYRDHWTKKQRERADYWIRKCSLRVYSYPAMSACLVGDEDNISAGYRIAIGDTSVRLVRDFVINDMNTKCIAELQPTMPMPICPLDVDCVIVGTRKDDRHYVFGDEPLVHGESWTEGETLFLAPLWDWTRQDVKDALSSRGIDCTEASEEEDTGNLVGFCTRCVEGKGDVFCPDKQDYIPSVEWNREVSRRAFIGSIGSMGAHRG